MKITSVRAAPVTFARLPRPARAAVMALAAAALLAALWAGLVRLGWGWPPLAPRLPGSHGPLMVSGFLGTLIGLERAVGMGRRWSLAGPALSGLGALLAIAPVPVLLPALLITVGSAVLVATLAPLLRIQRALFLIAIVLGSVLWLIGNLLWLAGWPIPTAVLWWMGFLVVTISGERLELSRMLRLSATARGLFAACLVLLVAGMALGTVAYAAGVRLLGVGLLAMALWLLRYDIAWRRLRAGGQARFVSLCLLAGYVWMAVGGLLAIARGGFTAGPVYDALLHSVFVGFVFSMIFGHALIIFPAVLQVPLAYSPRFYAHLVLLHLSLLLRVAGDLIPYAPARRWGGLLNALVVLLFLGGTALAARSARRTAEPARGH
jgi:hypothetical protein